MNPEEPNQQETTPDPNQQFVAPQINAKTTEGDVNNEALREVFHELNNLSSSNVVAPQYVGEPYQYNNVSTIGKAKEENNLKRKRIDLNISTEQGEEEEPEAPSFNEEEEKPSQKKKRGSTSTATTPKAKKKVQTPKKAAVVAPVTPKFNKKKVSAKFKYQGSISHPDAIKSIQFNQSHTDYLDSLLVIGGKYVTVHKLVESTKGAPVGLKLMKTFEDGADELTTGAWSVDTNGDPIIAVAGKSGVIKVWNFSLKAIKRDRFRMMRLPGHGGAVNEICFHPTKREFLASCSEDHSIRLWDLTLGRTIAIFADKSPVLSIDFHMSGTFLASSSQDGVKIWSVENPNDTRAMEYVNYLRNKQRSEYRSRRKNSGKTKATKEEPANSRKNKRPNANMNKTDFYYFYSSDEDSQQSTSSSQQQQQQQQQQPFSQMIVTPDGRITYQQPQVVQQENDENHHVVVPTIIEPFFSSSKIHSGAVSSIKYFGDLILSRASPTNTGEPTGRVVLWAPNSVVYSNENTHGQEKEQSFEDDFTTVYVFMTGQDGTCCHDTKMALDSYATQLAVPMGNGSVELFDLQKVEEEKLEMTTPKKRPRNSAGQAQTVVKRISEAIHVLQTEEAGTIRSVSFSFDQKFLVCGGDDKNIYKYDR
ncbi:hypothetical protein AKO1_012049 [Acrasis kona]|uniref:Guanine nucleotide-binding protein subunit beta-like protein n=1 Tax=Acrasis kona TaxID=1008807 RepID=A0AAW2Z9F0_9EUKA